VPPNHYYVRTLPGDFAIGVDADGVTPGENYVTFWRTGAEGESRRTVLTLVRENVVYWQIREQAYAPPRPVSDLPVQR
jgi:hypothetical protein